MSNTHVYSCVCMYVREMKRKRTEYRKVEREEREVGRRRGEGEGQEAEREIRARVSSPDDSLRSK